MTKSQVQNKTSLLTNLDQETKHCYYEKQTFNLLPAMAAEHY